MATSPVYIDVQENYDNRRNSNIMETKQKKIFSDRTMKSRDKIRTFALLGLVLLSLVILILAGIFITSGIGTSDVTCTNSNDVNVTCSPENSTTTDGDSVNVTIDSETTRDSNVGVPSDSVTTVGSNVTVSVPRDSETTRDRNVGVPSHSVTTVGSVPHDSGLTESSIVDGLIDSRETTKTPMMETETST